MPLPGLRWLARVCFDLRQSAHKPRVLAVDGAIAARNWRKSSPNKARSTKLSRANGLILDKVTMPNVARLRTLPYVVTAGSISQGSASPALFGR
jgi:hypothetical protein